MMNGYFVRNMSEFLLNVLDMQINSRFIKKKVNKGFVEWNRQEGGKLFVLNV